MAIRPKPTSKKFRFDVITKNSIRNAAENLVGNKSRQEPKKDILSRTLERPGPVSKRGLICQGRQAHDYRSLQAVPY